MKIIEREVCRVMQEVIRERRSCRNVFEVLDFICIEYETYMKARLVNLATGRSRYRNGFGLREKRVRAGIVDVVRVGQSSVFVMMQDDQEVTVDLASGACSQCSKSKFCAHVSGVACMYPEVMVRTVI